MNTLVDYPTSMPVQIHKKCVWTMFMDLLESGSPSCHSNWFPIFNNHVLLICGGWCYFLILLVWVPIIPIATKETSSKITSLTMSTGLHRNTTPELFNGACDPSPEQSSLSWQGECSWLSLGIHPAGEFYNHIWRFSLSMPTSLRLLTSLSTACHSNSGCGLINCGPSMFLSFWEFIDIKYVYSPFGFLLS